ncbi:HD domain-containing protein [Patescibacteria group bacterium]|nr:HD domain-containing protein [Patescibacteria group bacterium]
MGKNIASLNKANILSGKLFNLVPEFYELKNVIETNDWHPDISVFDHTLSVLKNLEKTLLVLGGNIKKTLNQKIDTNTRKILLKVATIFHDIVKKETLIDDNGITDCPGHDKMSVIKAEKILKRFNLSDKEMKFVLDILEYHHEFHKLLAPENQNFQKDFVILKNKFTNYIYPELVLLAFADTIDSNIRKTKPKEYRNRINFYKKEIEKLS